MGDESLKEAPMSVERAIPELANEMLGTWMMISEPGEKPLF